MWQIGAQMRIDAVKVDENSVIKSANLRINNPKDKRGF
jgi:hypothetical protein